MYVSFRRNNEPADWLNTYGGDFHHLTSIVPTLQGGTGSNKYTSYLTGCITIDIDEISHPSEQRRVSLKIHDYRMKPNRVSGKMRSNAEGTLDFWHYADNYKTVPTLCLS